MPFFEVGSRYLCSLMSLIWSLQGRYDKTAFQNTQTFLKYILNFSGHLVALLASFFICLPNLFAGISFLFDFYCKVSNATYHSFVPLSLLFKACKQIEGKAEAYMKPEHYTLYVWLQYWEAGKKYNITCKKLQPALGLYFVARIFIHTVKLG